MTTNFLNNKCMIVEAVGDLSEGQMYHIKMATDLSYDARTIASKLNITIGKVEAYRRCLEMGWLCEEGI